MQPHLNCSAMPVRSSVTQKNILPNLRMNILEQHWAEEETSPADDQSKFLLYTGGIIFLIWSLTTRGIKLTKEGIKLAACRASGNIRINHPTTNPTPESITPCHRPVGPIHGRSTGITRNITRQNNELQLPLEKNKAQIEALLLLYSGTTMPEQDPQGTN